MLRLQQLLDAAAASKANLESDNLTLYSKIRSEFSEVFLIKRLMSMPCCQIFAELSSERFFGLKEDTIH